MLVWSIHLQVLDQHILLWFHLWFADSSCCCCSSKHGVLQNCLPNWWRCIRNNHSCVGRIVSESKEPPEGSNSLQVGSPIIIVEAPKMLNIELLFLALELFLV